MIPWYYRCRFTNWLMARPDKHNFRVIYRVYRSGSSNRFTGKVYHPGYGRVRSAWLALALPHIHHESEL